MYNSRKHLRTDEKIWKSTNRCKCEKADRNCSYAQRVSEECKVVCVDKNETTSQNEQDVKQSLGLRVQEIDFWRSELEVESEALDADINKLEHYRNRLKLALNDCSQSLSVVEQCLQFRKSREGLDQIFDEPQKQLQQDVELLTEIKLLHSRMLEEVSAQNRKNSSMKLYLQHIIDDKQRCLEGDILASNLNRTSYSLSPGLLSFDSQSPLPKCQFVTESEWESIILQAIQKGKKHRKKSQDFHPLVESIMKQTTRDSQLQHKRVVLSFQNRIMETVQAKKLLEMRITKVIEEIGEIRYALAILEEEEKAKKPSLNLACHKLELRKQCQNLEICMDKVELELEKEVSTLQQAVQELHIKHQEAKNILQRLEGNKVELEKDIATKTKSLYIDEIQCLRALASVVITDH
ncbi:tektin-1-like [Limulus polyphemus]|uniref:Tektin n=1 Tax=Limulus polyphemus TaxID=6850 RepID=A0ABM1BV63_LIMPO|nr:tektin-1-like [Limulus polyphemus]XP_022257346.1 tektin-1-like [Limulus polyphemus]